MTDERAKFIGRRVRLYRDQAGLTQQQLADLSYVSRGYITRIENGLNIPAVPVLEQIAAALGVTREDLLDPKREPQPTAVERAAALWKETVERVQGVPILWHGVVPADALRYTAAVERGEPLHVPERWIQGVRDPFAMTVSGDCLEAIGIHSGNTVICERYRGGSIPNGAVVIVRIRDDVTMKQWYTTPDGIELRDGAGRVIEQLTLADDVRVEGIVVGHYREFTRL